KAPEVYSTPLMKICVFIDGQNFYRSLLRFDEALRVDYDKLARWITQAVGGSPATFAGAYYYVGVSADAPARVGGFLKGLEPRPVLRRGSPVGWDRRLPSRARARGRPRTLARTRAYRRPRWWFHVAPAGPSEHRSGARARPGGAAACGSAPAPREPRLLRHAMAVTSTSAGRPGARGARAADDRGRRVRRVRGDRRRRPFGPRHPESRRHDQPGRRVGRRLTPPDRTARQGMIAAMTLAERLAVFAADLDVTHVPPAVIESVKLRVLEVLGIALAASTHEFAPSVLAALESWGSGECTVVAAKTGAPLPLAILANGTLAHGLDFDDTHAGSITHASSGGPPAAPSAAPSPRRWRAAASAGPRPSSRGASVSTPRCSVARPISHRSRRSAVNGRRWPSATNHFRAATCCTPTSIARSRSGASTDWRRRRSPRSNAGCRLVKCRSSASHVTPSSNRERLTPLSSVCPTRSRPRWSTAASGS